MKIKLLVGAAVAALTLTTGGALAAEAQTIEPNGPDDRCPQWSDGTGWVGHNPGDGDGTMTFTAPDGWYVTDICVKAGSANQGDGPEFIHYDPPQHSVTFSHSSGKNISHWSVKKIQLEVPPTTTTSTTVPETTTTTVPETTTTTVPEETTTTTTPDETTTTVPDETTTTDPGRTTTTDPECEENPDTPEEDCLPRTGTETGLIVVGLALVLGGGTMVLLSWLKRRRLT